MKGSTRYAVRLVLALALYAILLVASILLIRANPEAGWHILVALVPALPGVMVAWVVAGEIGSRDEMQRQIQLEALAFAFAGTAVVALSLGLLEIAGVPQINGTFYVPIMAALWLLGQAIATRRYR